MEKNEMIYDTNEKPPIGKLLILALQHVFAMFGATILVPMLVNQEAGAQVISIPVTLISCGIGTLIYIACTKAKSPVFLGSSFAFITPIAVAYATDGISGVTSGIIGVGLIYILFAILIKLFGKNWIDKLIPPVVVGPMIIIIGLALAPNAVSQIGLAGGEVDWKSLIVALFSFLVTGFVAIKAKRFLKVIPFLIGIISGYILAICLGMVDFTSVKEASFFSVPNFVLPIKDYGFSLSGFLTMLPIAIVSIAEHIGDHMALSTIIKKDLIKDPGLERTILGDGLATLVAGIFGAPANTTYSQNTSVVGMSKVASVYVTGVASVIAIIMAFLGVVTAVLALIPNAVLGGAALILYGFIAVNGFKVLLENKVDLNNVKNVIIISVMLILGIGGAILTIKNGNIEFTFTGMSLAALVGIIMNLILPKSEEKEEKN